MHAQTRKLLVTLFILVSLVLCSFVIFGLKKQYNYIFDIEFLKKNGNIIPIAIIGSGPAGLSAAIYSARAKIYTVVFEGDKPGGLLTETTDVENWPGDISVLGRDLISRMKKQAEHLGVFFVSDTIESVDFSTWPFILHTQDGLTVRALSIIISTGATPRKLNIAGEKKYWGTGVTSCAVCDAPFFKNEDVVVVGGGDSAIEEALQLAPYAKSITILVRKESMRAAASMQERLKAYKHIHVLYNVEINKINGEKSKVTSIELLNNKTNKIIHMPTSGVFLAIGHDPNTKLFRSALKINEQGYIKLKGRSQQTSIPGIFAAGDVEDYTYRQAGVAAGSGIKAALDAVAFLNKINFSTHISAELEQAYFKVQKNSESLVHQVRSLEDFLPIINTGELIIADFYTDYCPSCLQMLPAFEAISQEYAAKATFLKINADQAEDIVTHYFVLKVPCLLVFKGGTLVARYHEPMNKKELGLFIEQFLDKPEQA